MTTLGDTAPGLTLAILVLGADFNVSAEEKRTLSQLIWHLFRKGNDFVLKDLMKIEAKENQIDIITLIQGKGEIFSGDTEDLHACRLRTAMRSPANL